MHESALNGTPSQSAAAERPPSIDGQPTSPIRVREVGDDLAPSWDLFAASQPSSTAYHRYAWRGLLRGVFKLETHYLAAFAGDQLSGILPLARQKSRLFGDYLISLPYFNYAGMCYEHPHVRDALIQAADALARDLGVEYVELRHSADHGLKLPCRTDKISMVLELPASADDLRASLKAKVRSQIKRPEREGITCEIGGTELLREFHRVFARNMRDLGTPAYPLRFFHEVMQIAGTSAGVFIARLNGEPVASALVVGYREVLEIPWASSLRAANKLGVNMYLYWQILRWAIESGYRQFDFGRCTEGGGTYRFKKQWGSRTQQLYWHYLLYATDKLPQVNHSNPKYKTLIRLWQQQPVAVANVLSPLLVRHLP